MRSAWNPIDKKINKMKNEYFATAESVAAGHPDKVADAISDAILDAHLARDPQARVAAETLVHAHPNRPTGQVTLAGEITSRAAGAVDHEAIVRRVLRRIGYTDLEKHGFDAEQVTVVDTIGQQSREIHRAAEKGAGDQGIVYGYATRTTATGIPLPLEISHALMRRVQEVREKHDWLGPDGKAQISVRHNRLAALVLSLPVGLEVSAGEAERFVLEQVCRPVLNRYFPTKEWSSVPFQFNTGGRWSVGGPLRDAGLTGRKLAVDTYGGLAPHGGGAFSGKDASKMDRAGAYAARELALWVLRHPIFPDDVDEVVVGLAFAIGVEQPVAIHFPGLNAGLASIFEGLIRDAFDLSPAGIRSRLDLTQPFFERTAAFGHFGRPGEFRWEGEGGLALKEKTKPQLPAFASATIIRQDADRRTPPDFLRRQEEMRSATDEELIRRYRSDWNNRGWVSARATFLAALALELERRFDCSAVIDGDRFLIGGPKTPQLVGRKIVLV